jgi:hypothetical protein
MAARSRANKIADGHKANQTKIARFGPHEPGRAFDQARWKMANPNRPENEKPFLREKVYSPAILARAEKHKAWMKANPQKDHPENPYSWSGGSD